MNWLKDINFHFQFSKEIFLFSFSPSLFFLLSHSIFWKIQCRCHHIVLVLPLLRGHRHCRPTTLLSQEEKNKELSSSRSGTTLIQICKDLCLLFLGFVDGRLKPINAVVLEWYHRGYCSRFQHGGFNTQILIFSIVEEENFLEILVGKITRKNKRIQGQEEERGTSSTVMQWQPSECSENK